MKNLKQKMKSYSFWTALSGAVVILIGSISKAFGLSLDSEIAEEIIMGVCGVLVAVGLVSAKSEKTTDKNSDSLQEKQDLNKQELDDLDSSNENLPNELGIDTDKKEDNVDNTEN